MVHGDQQGVIDLAESCKPDAHRLAAREIERASCFVIEQSLQTVFAPGLSL